MATEVIPAEPVRRISLSTRTDSEDDSHHNENDSYYYKIAANMAYRLLYCIFYSGCFSVIGLFLINRVRVMLLQVLQFSTTIGTKAG